MRKASTRKLQRRGWGSPEGLLARASGHTDRFAGRTQQQRQAGAETVRVGKRHIVPADCSLKGRTRVVVGTVCGQNLPYLVR